MIDHKSVLAVIPARKGSKGLPGKNLLPFIDKPMIGWSFEAAKASSFIDRIILSSNDEDVITYAKSVDVEVPYLRSEDLSTDDAKGVDVVIDAVNKCPGFDYVMLLQPTSPLRTFNDIDAACELMLRTNSPSCISIVKSKSNPHWMYLQNNSSRLQRFTDDELIARRQDLPSVYEPNGAIYIAKVSWLIEGRSLITSETVGYEMPRNRSIDIDTAEDFKLAEFYFHQDHLTS